MIDKLIETIKNYRNEYYDLPDGVVEVNELIDLWFSDIDIQQLVNNNIAYYDTIENVSTKAPLSIPKGQTFQPERYSDVWVISLI